jgi:5'-methylthioadenosine phosphorylase
MQVDVAIIGGTGVGERLRELGGDALVLDNSFGKVDASVIEHDGLRLMLVSRHSSGHKIPPHKVNYRAIAEAISASGAKGCFSSAAVGGLRPALTTGDFVACSDFLDYTNRQLTMFDDQVVHTDFSEPFSARLRQALVEAGTERGIVVQSEGVYVCTNGPRYETPHEVRTYAQLGGDVIGMTAASEAILMHELGVPYACLAVVTNHAAGIGENPLSHDEVAQAMEAAGATAVEIISSAAKKIA